MFESEVINAYDVYWKLDFIDHRVCFTMMSLLRFTILVIVGVVTAQNQDVNSEIPYGRRQRSVEATTSCPMDPKMDNEGIQLLLTRFEALCVEKLEMLITDTNTRFESLEKQLSRSSSCPASPVVQNFKNLEAKMENLEVKMEHLGKDIQVLITDSNRRFQSLENQSSEVHSIVGNIFQNNLETKVENLGKNIQESSYPASPAVQNIENLEAKVENLEKQFLESIQELMNATRNLPSDVGAKKLNVSSLINVTRSLVDSNCEVKQVCNEGLHEVNDLQTSTSTSPPLKFTAKNCKEVGENKKTASGNYMIQPEGAPKPFEVVCDLATRGGGWTVIQRRFDGSQDFYLGWEDYKKGFGNLRGEFWLGLENIHLLTGFEKNELLIELGDFESHNISALYSEFQVGSEIEGYSLKVLGAYSGDAGNTLDYNIGKKFSTKDNDQDTSQSHCAQLRGGAWWYGDCTNSNLNGKNSDRDVTTNKGIIWFNYKHAWKKFKHTKMSVRPKV